MIELSHQIPQQDTRHALPLTRTPTKGELRVLCSVDQIIGTYLHWYAGRSQPCRGETCKPCLEGAPARWMSYLAGRIADGHKHALVELPRLAAQQVHDWYQENGSLRGTIITLARLSKRSNGRVIAQVVRPDPPRDDVPPHPDMHRCLATLWQIKLSDFSNGKQTRAGRDVEVHPDTPAQENDPTHIKPILVDLERNLAQCPASPSNNSSSSSESGSRGT